MAWFLFLVLEGWTFPYPTLGLGLIALIGLIDDWYSTRPLIRLLVQVISVTLMFVELTLFELMPIWELVFLTFLCVATLNAINFMDGINGMTGLYFLVVMGWFYLSHDPSVIHTLIGFILVSLMVFGFFNFRKKAHFFAGDIGSLGIGYITLFVLLYYASNSEPSGRSPINYNYFLVLSVYGIDVFWTLIQRLWQKENILTAHRKHLYQVLVNQFGWSHLVTAAMYASIQIILLVAVLDIHSPLLMQAWWIILLSGLYLAVKYKLISKSR